MRHSSPILVAVTVAMLSAGRADAQTATPKPRATEAFRKEHIQIREHLDHVTARLTNLAGQKNAKARAQAMTFVVKFFTEHLEPHAAWEEKALYPAVDHRVHDGVHPFTESMRFEHRVVGRWIRELQAEAAKPAPSVAAFVLRAHQLVGLVTAHFEAEEAVLLPVLDASTTPEELTRELERRAADTPSPHEHH